MLDVTEHKLYKEHDLDSVVSNVFKIYLKRFPVLFISSFLFVFSVQFTLYQLGFWEVYKLSNPEDIIKAFSFLAGKIGIVMLITVLMYGLMNAFHINYIFSKESGRDCDIGSIISETMSKYTLHMIFYLILSVLMFFVGSMVGLIAFIIGFFIALLYLAVVLFPGLTVIVAEKSNAIEAIGRSFSLSHKDFWPILGVILLFFVIVIFISLVINAIIAIPFVMAFFEGIKDYKNIFEALNLESYNMGTWTIVINSIVSAITYPIYTILSVVIYFKLKFTEDKKIIK
ncbi:MAG TPA: hypothetical protein P5132_01690 [Bacteroidales bacterium]|nr:hypothetical protein [Bacteroidales bacterium]